MAWEPKTGKLAQQWEPSTGSVISDWSPKTGQLVQQSTDPESKSSANMLAIQADNYLREPDSVSTIESEPYDPGNELNPKQQKQPILPERSIEGKRPDNRIGFVEAFAEDPIKFAPFIGSLARAGESLDVLSAAKRLEKNKYQNTYRTGEFDSAFSKKNITEPDAFSMAVDQKASDMKLVKKYMEDMKEKAERGYSFGGRVGQVLGELPAVMVEYLGTGGLATAGKEAVKTGVVKAMGEGAESMAGRAASGLVGLSTEAGVRTALNPQRVIEGAAKRRLPKNVAIDEDGDVSFQWPKENPSMSFVKAVGDSYIEMFSEASGGALTKAVKPSGKMLTSLMKKSKLGNEVFDLLYKGYQKIEPAMSKLEFADRIASKAGFHGVVGELDEEYLGAGLRAIANIDDFGTESKNPLVRLSAAMKQMIDQTPEMAVAFSVPGAMRYGVGAFAGRGGLEFSENTPSTDEVALESMLPREAVETPVEPPVEITPEEKAQNRRGLIQDHARLYRKLERLDPASDEARSITSEIYGVISQINDIDGIEDPLDGRQFYPQELDSLKKAKGEAEKPTIAESLAGPTATKQEFMPGEQAPDIAMPEPQATGETIVSPKSKQKITRPEPTKPSMSKKQTGEYLKDKANAYGFEAMFKDLDTFDEKTLGYALEYVESNPKVFPKDIYPTIRDVVEDRYNAAKYSRLLPLHEAGDKKATAELNKMQLPTYDELIARVEEGDKVAADMIVEGRYREMISEERKTTNAKEIRSTEATVQRGGNERPGSQEKGGQDIQQPTQPGPEAGNQEEAQIETPPSGEPPSVAQDTGATVKAEDAVGMEGEPPSKPSTSPSNTKKSPPKKKETRPKTTKQLEEEAKAKRKAANLQRKLERMDKKAKSGGRKGMSQEQRERNPIGALVEDNGGIRPFKDNRLPELYSQIPLRFRATGVGLTLDDMMSHAQNAGMISEDASLDDLVTALQGKKKSVESAANEFEKDQKDREEYEKETFDRVGHVDLDVDDEFTINGEKYKVTKETDTALKIADGTEFWIPFESDETILIDKNSLKKRPKGPGSASETEEAPDFLAMDLPTESLGTDKDLTGRNVVVDSTKGKQSEMFDKEKFKTEKAKEEDARKNDATGQMTFGDDIDTGYMEIDLPDEPTKPKGPRNKGAVDFSPLIDAGEEAAKRTKKAHKLVTRFTGLEEKIRKTLIETEEEERDIPIRASKEAVKLLGKITDKQSVDLLLHLENPKKFPLPDGTTEKQASDYREGLKRYKRFLQEAGRDADWPTSTILALQDRYYEIDAEINTKGKRATTKAKLAKEKAAIESRIEKLLDLEYIHRIYNKKKATTGLSQRFRKITTNTSLLKQRSFDSLEDAIAAGFNPRHIAVSFADYAAEAQRVKLHYDLIQAINENPSLSMKEKIAPGDWKRIDNRLMPTAQGRKYHPAIAEAIDELMYSSNKEGFVRIYDSLNNALKQLMFYNPIVMTKNDLFQAWRATGFGFVTKAAKAFNAVKNKDDTYEMLRKMGLFNNVVSLRPAAQSLTQDMLDRIHKSAGRRAAESMAKWIIPSQLINDIRKANDLTTWKIDEWLRTAVALDLLEGSLVSSAANKLSRGHFPKSFQYRNKLTDFETVEIANDFMANYGKVPKKARQSLNRLFFTPTYRISMARALAKMYTQPRRYWPQIARHIAYKMFLRFVLPGLTSMWILGRDWEEGEVEDGFRIAVRDPKGKEKDRVFSLSDPLLEENKLMSRPFIKSLEYNLAAVPNLLLNAVRPSQWRNSDKNIEGAPEAIKFLNKFGSLFKLGTPLVRDIAIWYDTDKTKAEKFLNQFAIAYTYTRSPTKKDKETGLKAFAESMGMYIDFKVQAGSVDSIIGTTLKVQFMNENELASLLRSNTYKKSGMYGGKYKVYGSAHKGKEDLVKDIRQRLKKLRDKKK